MYLQAIVKEFMVAIFFCPVFPELMLFLLCFLLIMYYTARYSRMYLHSNPTNFDTLTNEWALNVHMLLIPIELMIVSIVEGGHKDSISGALYPMTVVCIVLGVWFVARSIISNIRVPGCRMLGCQRFSEFETPLGYGKVPKDPTVSHFAPTHKEDVSFVRSP